MAKKVFINREIATPTVRAHSVSSEEPDSEVASSSRNISGSETKKSYPFSFWMRLQILFQHLILQGVV